MGWRLVHGMRGGESRCEVKRNEHNIQVISGRWSGWR